VIILVAGISLWFGGLFIGFAIGIRFAKWGDFKFWLIG
jgi:hypothetical protein